jgi:precorrin-2 dehydrogenase / sirohydrochlorin ferrochelatase
MTPHEPPALFPAFLKLAGRACLVVGAGAVGQSKIEGLLETGAAITVVAPEATEAVHAWAAAGSIKWLGRPFEPFDLDGMFLVVAATSLPELNETIFREARRRGVLCNVVDDPPHCDFYYPAVVRRGALQIAVSTDGKSPALAQRLRKEFEQAFGPVYRDWIQELGSLRERLFRQEIDADERRQLLHRAASRESFENFARRREPAA